VRSARKGENSISARKMRGKKEAASREPWHGAGGGAKDSAADRPWVGQIDDNLDCYLLDTIPGQSPAICEYRQRLLRVLRSPSTLLVTGETGSGKSHLIEHILRPLLWQGEDSFTVIDLAAIAPPLIQSELFGCVRGAYSGSTTTRPGLLELASGGAVLLDEIGELPLSVQGVLLRAIQEGAFRPVGGSRWHQMHGRIIALTNRNLAEMVERKEFRSDLFYRLNCLSLRLPALRTIGEDILLYAIQFLERHCTKHGKCNMKLTVAAKRSLLNHDWPGNLRELDHVIEQAVLLCDSDVLDAHDIENAITSIPVKCSVASKHDKAAEDSDSRHAERPATAYDRFISLIGPGIQRQSQSAANGKTSGSVPLQIILQASVLAVRAALGCRATQNNIGQFLGISQSKVSRILAGAGSAV
jgi:transcriptional regulator with GAF, ATPase, and Fis domain